ncbi:hypothetical protein B0A55_04407 [Friedmanniomyces simplex]|uniref:alpha-1,2-Mannosidase n=1 Tax=Friedmanniomyces simplex TaxID=329884 RepID=A0A4U0XL93_9PEZI|nr:hypothetical protein B0A55_04407 [Friedmanniomyces simplex]
MISLRRYTVFVALGALILLLGGYFHEPIVTQAKYRFRSQVPLTAQPGEAPAAPAPTGPFRWDAVPTQYPVAGPLAQLPTGTPQKLPRVQYQFPKESIEHAATRKERLAAVNRSFERCWQAYKQHAWGHDELAPLSGGVRDGFGGWAANLVDNLDNLWIMGMKEDFAQAVDAAVNIDLGVSTTETINVFETTIRHLGGFLAAYDFSGDKRLLEKAKELGEMLLKAFDTPNHLPITRWKPQEALKGNQEADPVVLVAELGSLTMEFTRLSQITGDPKWYDAVARITRLFDEQQEKTHLPGMWPVVVNAKAADLTEDTFFSLGAMSDSLYEYFPKMHALLGGLEPVYKKLYTGSMSTAIENNLWRPMVPENADILMSGNVRASSQELARLDPQGQHLVCFAGGMFALGGKLFDEPAHVEIGKKLTNGCIWAYKALPLGIMPEVFNMVACDSRVSCQWDEDKWRQEVKNRHSEKPDVDELIKDFRLPKGFTDISDRRYILRPEAIESVFILHRITGEQYLQDAAWDMFTAITNATTTELANAALSDVTFSPAELAQGTTGGTTQFDSMESFWMAETLKYFYLIFSEPDVISLDEWMFNTEAHPFKLQHEIQRRHVENPIARDQARIRKRQSKTVQESLANEETLYFMNATVGTPAQDLRLHIDTGSSDLWVNVATSQLCSSQGSPCSASGTYAPNSSSTYQYLNGEFNITYVDGSGSAGDYVSDTVEFGGVTLKNQQLGIGYTSTSGEGIIGIGYPINEVATQYNGGSPYPNVPLHLMQNGDINSNAYSLWLNDLEASTGSILFGGVNTDKFTGELQTLPIIKEQGYYAEFIIALTAVGANGTTGSLANNIATPALLDSGSSLMYLPDNIVQTIYNDVGAQYDSSQGAAFVDCSLANSDATIDFTFSSPTIRVAMKELVIVAGVDAHNNPLCIIGISPADGSTPVLGDTFIRSAYIVYDMSNNEISIAQTNFNSTSDNIVEITNSTGVPSATAVANAVTSVAVASGGARIGSGPTGITSSAWAIPTAAIGYDVALLGALGAGIAHAL